MERVGLLVETSHEFGRELLRGIRRYDQENATHWRFFFVAGRYEPGFIYQINHGSVME